MEKIIIDNIFQLKQYNIEPKDNVFEKILEERKGTIDSDRFFLEYLPKEVLNEYDFNDINSIKKFRNTCLSSINKSVKGMGGYNMDPSYLKEDIRYAGLKMSDPYGKVYGMFDVRNEIITYLPLFAHFYEERDLAKFAHDTYYTTMTFEDIMFQQIDQATSFYVHVGDYCTAKEIAKNGRYILEKINKDQMIEFVRNPEEGAKVFKKVNNFLLY